MVVKNVDEVSCWTRREGTEDWIFGSWLITWRLSDFFSDLLDPPNNRVHLELTISAVSWKNVLLYEHFYIEPYRFSAFNNPSGALGLSMAKSRFPWFQFIDSEDSENTFLANTYNSLTWSFNKITRMARNLTQDVMEVFLVVDSLPMVVSVWSFIDFECIPCFLKCPFQSFTVSFFSLLSSYSSAFSWVTLCEHRIWKEMTFIVVVASSWRENYLFLWKMKYYVSLSSTPYPSNDFVPNEACESSRRVSALVYFYQFSIFQGSIWNVVRKVKYHHLKRADVGRGI